MKVTQSALLNSSQAAEAKKLGATLARLRIARGMKQETAALRAGLSRNTAYRLEKGDPGIAIGHLLRYLEAIAPGKSLIDSLTEDGPALQAATFAYGLRYLERATALEIDPVSLSLQDKSAVRGKIRWG